MPGNCSFLGEQTHRTPQERTKHVAHDEQRNHQRPNDLGKLKPLRYGCYSTRGGGGRKGRVEQ